MSDLSINFDAIIWTLVWGLITLWAIYYSNKVKIKIEDRKFFREQQKKRYFKYYFIIWKYFTFIW